MLNSSQVHVENKVLQKNLFLSHNEFNLRDFISLLKSSLMIEELASIHNELELELIQRRGAFSEMIPGTSHYFTHYQQRLFLR